MISVAPLRCAKTGGPTRVAEVDIVAPRRSYTVDSEAGRLWILPESWKTPRRPEIDRCVILAFPTTPWTGYARPHDPQPRQLPISLKAKVMYDPLHWIR